MTGLANLAMSPDAKSKAAHQHSSYGASVFALIHELHRTITDAIDTSLNWEQLNSPAVNYTLIRPIIERLVPTSEKGAKRPTTADSLLAVPSQAGSEEDGRAVGTAGQGSDLGMILYALMANR